MSLSGVLALDEVIAESLPVAKDLHHLLGSLLQTFKKISFLLRETSVTKKGSFNTYGEEQLSVDLLAENLLETWANEEPTVRATSSEENSVIKECQRDGTFIVCWDPLDGSSIVDCNWSVGTIVSIWQVGVNGVEWKGTDSLIGCTGRQQVASAMAVYGPHTTALVAVSGKTHDFFLNGEVFQKMPLPVILPVAKIFSPANLKACNSLPAYRTLVDYWISEGYTLRYTGGLVPDVYQLFRKGHGIFCNPVTEKAPPKLRLLYEIVAIANLIECAGGKSSDGKNSILDMVITSLDQRVQFCAGSENEVNRFEKIIGVNSKI
ncbi:sedoheptulose-1,7-bisphosphatase [Cardiosporidium cionae]|uniref:Sedoheptulose-1,7-bisphosphatase n=1 Tax=Cardiosporidium cionae TaxID=476202 RepID=A0ABQ7JDQ4_9APIC|nr:sedoheptulose-1,7-bisphosphatase [Cardiosporidium cionae]|eukprot:KAF8822133.1 sedoheptulose-1,7-bisphosphatase [Cardiosporidium cionae]